MACKTRSDTVNIGSYCGKRYCRSVCRRPGFRLHQIAPIFCKMTDDQTQVTTPVEPTTDPVVEETAVEETAREATPEVAETTEAPEVAEETSAMDGTNEAPVEETVEMAEEPQEKTTEKAKPMGEEVEETKPASNVPADAKWYIVHTYSGHENKVARGIQQRSETMGFTDKVYDIIVPTREVTKVSQGKKSQVQEKIFPGYVLVRMILTDETWLMVRTTQGVTAFIGAGNKPTPISEKEVEAIQKFMKLEEPLYKTGFSVSEAVKIVDGPFADFLGTIESIDDAKGKLRVLVSIFGRETPVELDFLQVAKI